MKPPKADPQEVVPAERRVVRLLLVEDDPLDAELAIGELRGHGFEFEVRIVDDESAFRTALDRFEPHLVLSDLSLPGFTGYRALDILREVAPATPFILLSGTIGEEVAVESLQRGAADYILKGNMTRLGPAVARALREAREAAAHELAEQRLLRSQRYESLALLAAGLSHDLRNILQPLLIASSVIEERDDPALKRLGELVRDCAQRGLDMAQTMLSFARGAGSAREQVRVATLFDSLALLLQGSLPRGIELHIERGPGDLVLEGNHTEMQQCVLNLCLNALQAMPDGGRLTLSCEPVELDADFFREDEVAAPGSHIRISIVDTGVGMDEAALGNLFRPFYTTKSTGTGLGLVSCKRIVVNHAGVLRVSSQPGVGTRFDLYLPVRQPRAASEPVIVRGAGRRVLILSERETKLAILRDLLERHDYVVKAAQCGAEALLSMQGTELPDAVIMEAEMNLMSGVRTLAELVDREYPGVVVLLAKPDARPDPDELPPLRHIRIVDRPVIPGELLHALGEALDAARQTAPGAEPAEQDDSLA
jgi:signal transduction histidine kinase